MQHVGALHADAVSLHTKLRYQHIGAIIFHNLLNLVKALKDHIVDFVRRDLDFFHDRFGVSSKFMQFRFGSEHIIRMVGSDEDLVLSPPISAWRTISAKVREGRREVDRGVGCGLDLLDIASHTSADYRMQRQLELKDVDLAFQLPLCQ